MSYFKAEFGYYNWARLPVTLSSAGYRNFLNAAPAGSPADSMLANASVVVFAVPSKRWIVWAERETGICVLATADRDIAPAWNGLDWVTRLNSTAEMGRVLFGSGGICQCGQGEAA